jgi:CheY-like chemotaxis protein
VADVTERVFERDTGIGISAESQAHIFEAFSQADGSTTRKYGGTGLGLAIAKQLVILMGGDIHLQSAPGEGARFRFTAYFRPCAMVQKPLPSPAHRSVGESKPTDQRPPGPAGVRILLVEDNPVNRVVACGMLETLNCHIETAENGREAVAALETTEYALVFMDCQMPVMDGLTATRLIREREANAEQPANNTAHRLRRRVPIVALTAHAMQGDRELCIAAGMDDYLTKPFTLAQLEHALTRWLPKNDAEKSVGDSASATPSEKPMGGDQPTIALREGKLDGTMVEPTVIDRSALAAIRALQRPGHPDIVARIVSQYVETSREIVERIRRAVLSKDAAELRASAHPGGSQGQIKVKIQK